MRSIFVFVGFIVVMILLSNTGILRGSVCAPSVGCVTSDNAGLRLHANDTP